MRSRHSALTIGTSPGAIYADPFADCGADVVRVARSHRPRSLTGQGQAADDSYSKPALTRTVHLGRAATRGIPAPLPPPVSLERAFSDLLHEVRPEHGVRLRISIGGKRQALRPSIQEQLFLIGKEAIVNALRHSKATEIEVEVEYLRCSVCIFVRDNGCGIRPDLVQMENDSHSGLREMRDRADTIGAQFGIWSRPGAGTEVRVAVQRGDR
jgi:signal transduction histidine kinase